MQISEQACRGRVFAGYRKVIDNVNAIFGDLDSPQYGLISLLFGNRVDGRVKLLFSAPPINWSMSPYETRRLMEEMEKRLLGQRSKNLSPGELDFAQKKAGDLFDLWEVNLQQVHRRNTPLASKYAEAHALCLDLLKEFLDRERPAYLTKSILQMLEAGAKERKELFNPQDWEPLVTEIVENPEAFRESISPAQTQQAVPPVRPTVPIYDQPRPLQPPRKSGK